VSVPVRVAAIHQPNLFPRMATLAKLCAADIWIVLDDVQFTRRDYQHRARLGCLADPSTQQWLSLSVTLPFGRRTSIDRAQVVDVARCQRRIQRMTRQHYGRAPYWRSITDEIQAVADLLGSTDRLVEVTLASCRALLTTVGWTGEIVLSSEFTVRTERSARLADLTRAVGATHYLCGTGGQRYLEASAFDELGLRVHYFAVPEAVQNGIWQHARKISALAAITEAGPRSVGEQLRSELRVAPGIDASSGLTCC
jgi:hypothetical protein